MTPDHTARAASGQALFAAALLDPAGGCPPGLRVWNGSDPERRLAVYRNNVLASLIDALAETFPVVAQLVGEDFFRAMAAVYVRAEPPRLRILAHYGDTFAEFVAGFPPAAGLPYLPDVARLEFARQSSCHAADAEPLGAEALMAALRDPAELAALCLVWHPSLRLVASPHAVVSLWSGHQTDGEVQPVDIERAESAIVLRQDVDVLVLPVDAGTVAFVRQTAAGEGLGTAAAAALAADSAFDLGAALSGLIAHGALVSILSSPTSPRCTE